MTTNYNESALSTLSKAVHDAAAQAIEDKLVPRDAVPAMSDWMSGNNQAAGAEMRGSIIRLTKEGATTYKVVLPGEADPVTGGADLKLKCIDKWAAAAKSTKVSDLGDAGADAVLLGVLTSGGAAGPAAAGLKVNGLPAKVGPPASGTAGAIAS